MKRFALAIALACVLSGSTLAGITHTPPVLGDTNSPPGEILTPPGETHTPPGQTETPPGETHSGPGDQPEYLGDTLATVILTIITLPR